MPKELHMIQLEPDVAEFIIEKNMMAKVLGVTGLIGAGKNR